MQATAVVVPAHEEEEGIGACLASIAAALGHPALVGMPTQLVVVLDRCSDRTGELAEAALRGCPGGAIVEVKVGNVGQARAAGLENALLAFAGMDLDKTWLATTDADSVVPAGWLARQLAWARLGNDAVAGTVEVSGWQQRSARAEGAYRAYVGLTGRGVGHPHVHGANLGLSGAAYRAAGGMPPMACAEDHALWDALGRSGHRQVSVPDCTVSTSARREPRAVGGFGDFLTSLESRADVQSGRGVR